MGISIYGELNELVTIDDIVKIIENKGFTCYQITKNPECDRIDFRGNNIDTYLTFYKDQEPFLDTPYLDVSLPLIEDILAIFGGRILRNSNRSDEWIVIPKKE